MLQFPFPVAPRVAIDQRFVTRDLLRGIAVEPASPGVGARRKAHPTVRGPGVGPRRVPDGRLSLFRGRCGVVNHSSRVASPRTPRAALAEQHRAFFPPRRSGARRRNDGRTAAPGRRGTPRDLAYFDGVTTHGSHRRRAHRGQRRGCRPRRTGGAAAEPLIDAAVVDSVQQPLPELCRSRWPRPLSGGHQARLGCSPCRTGVGSAGGGRLRVSGP